MIKYQKIQALYTGILCGIFFFIIDGIFWWNSGVREMFGYWSTIPSKYLVDFMMTFSYGVVAFSWVYIMFTSDPSNHINIIKWTSLVFGGWLLVGMISQWLPLIDLQIMTVRHMNTLRILEIVVVICGYSLLIILGYKFKQLLYIFWIGSMLTFMMEFPLMIFAIRPSGLDILIYDTLILTNQGVPYAFIIVDKIIPVMKDKLSVSREIESEVYNVE
ncbi:MAG: hypothetical protein GF317_24295 [Candidatus Lokiarchaeota archaeon]|nr:hypothetical protein [Candidatus Lokiarchaeota archaeon]MBD3202495.1 hypothetical protein [Candidatus Lokiarchaeota archaeon]